MGTIKYTMAIMFTLAAALVTWAGYMPSSQEFYTAWRDGAGLSPGDQHHYYLCATVLAVDDGQATVRVGIGGMMKGYLLSISGALPAGPSSEYMPVGETKMMAERFDGFTDLDVTLPVTSMVGALAVTLQPSGSFDDTRSLRIYLPIEARPDVMVQAAALDTAAPAAKVSCPTGCHLFSHSFPPPCTAGTQYICCRSNQFVVDGTRCTIRCQNADPCPVIVTDPADTVKVDTSRGHMR